MLISLFISRRLETGHLSAFKIFAKHYHGTALMGGDWAGSLQTLSDNGVRRTHNRVGIESDGDAPSVHSARAFSDHQPDKFE